MKDTGKKPVVYAQAVLTYFIDPRINFGSQFRAA